MSKPRSILIMHAELIDASGKSFAADVRCVADKIIAVGQLTADVDEPCVDAKGGLLIPGLNDHHAHLASYAASLQSVRCGPPEVNTEAELVDAINVPGNGWLRGTGFHERVCPRLDRTWLDRFGPDRPIRIQHRSGRLWILNTLAVDQINAAATHLAAHDQVRLRRADGLFYDVDELLGGLIQSEAPPIAQASQNLVELGVTGINDMTPGNDLTTWNWFAGLQRTGDLKQRVRMSGRPGLTHQDEGRALCVGETKVHLHDSALPEFEDLVRLMMDSHTLERCVAVHCVTEVELVFTLAAFRAAGTLAGDRLEHASVMPSPLIEQVLELGLSVVTQPNFIFERGDAYIRDIPYPSHNALYRIGSLIDHGVQTAFGTDLPFGQPDPWAAMRSATERLTASGQPLGENETVTPEQALNGFMGSLQNPFGRRSVTPGVDADLCLMRVPWGRLREDLAARHVRMTVCRGELIDVGAKSR